MSIKAFYPLAAAIVAFGLLTGCGGGNSSAASASNGEITVETGSLSKAAFTRQANALCKDKRSQWEREYTQVLRGYSTISPEVEQRLQVKLVHTILVPTEQKLIDQISSLGAPDGDGEDIVAFLGALQQNLKAVAAKPGIAFTGISPFGSAIKLAKAYGLTGCADSLT